MDRVKSARMLKGELHFERQVDRWVLDAVNEGANSFEELLLALPGVYPFCVLQAMRHLVATDQLAEDRLERAVAEIAHWSTIANAPGAHDVLPVPHPLDYDWRFGGAAIDKLLKECLTATQPDDAVALLGTPTLLATALERGFPRQMVLLDRDAQVMLHLAKSLRPGYEVLICDVQMDALPARTALAVVADPPWYAEEMRAFLWAASYLCLPGGRVFMSMPPMGTRPAIEWERKELLQWATTVGLAPLGIEGAALPYRSPLFERNALGAQQVRTLPSNWRRGDLAVFERQTAPLPARPLARREATWMEETVNGVRFRIRDDGVKVSHLTDPTLVPLIPGEILPTVSRRDRRRNDADVWTSGNRIYHCRSPQILAAVVHSMSACIDPLFVVEGLLARGLAPVERGRVVAAIEKIAHVVATERAEAARLD